MEVVSFSYSISKLNEIFKQKLHETETFHVGNTKERKRKWQRRNSCERQFLSLQGTFELDKNVNK